MSDAVEREEEEEVAGGSDILGMSDADLMNLDPRKLMQAAPVEGEQAAAEGGEQEEEGEEGNDEGGEEEEGTTDAGDEAGEGEDEGEGGQEPTGDAAKPGAEDAAKAAEEAKKDDKTKEEPVSVNFEAEYKRLMAPFKANGKDVQVQSVDDAISLMQMGANYTKKMAALKPNLKLLKLLENNGLLSEEKLSFLIDLDKKSPEAIGKLLKDSGIDPLDVDVEKVGEYKPKAYAVDDRELALDAVLDEVQGTPTYGKMIEVVSNKWDAPSKQVIADNPQLLKVINDHMASGYYDLISNEMERERMFGRLAGLSDIEAYRQVGDAINARGGFNHLGKAPVEKQTPAAKVPVTPKAKAEDPALRDKKRAASPTKAAPSVKGNQEFNPLALSDEEFAKIDVTKRFL